MTRKAVQIAATVSGEGTDRRESLYALDDEGRIWIIDPYQRRTEWSEIQALPEKASPKAGVKKISGLT